VKISNKRYEGYMGVMPLLLSKDRTHIMFGGSIVRLADDYLISLDTLKKDIPDGVVGCGFNNISINSNYPEVLFRRACDIDEFTSILNIGVFDYKTNKYTLLDSLVGFQDCNRPTFAPDGLRIAFIADGDLHIMFREIQDEK
jgi:hypothetical protein